MKDHWLALLLVVGAALFVPAASAKIVEEKSGCVVTTGTDNLRLPEMALSGTQTISQGQTQSYTTSVPRGKTSFFADLNWGVSSNSLALTITAPDATLGPYYDAADGRIDCRINLRITKTSGLESGT
jgi:hypothetical protein